MSKVAIVTDSNSGLTQAQAKELGIRVMPMPFYINEEMLLEDIDLTQEQFYEKLEQGGEIKTSMPLVGDVTDKWDELLKDYDEIVYIPMSSGLSGSCQSAALFARDYDGKVQVVDNHRISVTQRESVISALRLAEQGYDAGQIREFLEKHAYDASIYITVDSMEYLKKGGRVTPAAATLATVLNLKPILRGDEEGHIVTCEKVRGRARAIANLAARYETRAVHPELQRVAITHGDCPEDAQALAERIRAIAEPKELIVCPHEPFTGAHVGPGMLGLFFFGNGRS